MFASHIHLHKNLPEKTYEDFIEYPFFFFIQTIFSTNSLNNNNIFSQFQFTYYCHSSSIHLVIY